MSYELVFKNVLFPAYEKLVKRRDTAAHVAEYSSSEQALPGRLKKIQLDKLNCLLNHCWSEVPFLKEYWSAHGCKPLQIVDLDELQNYPLLTKQLISENYELMIARNWKGRTLSKTTGGSTGDPFRFEYTMDVYARRTAVMWRGYGWAGAGLGTRTAYVWGAGGGLKVKDRMYHRAFNRRFFDAFGMSEDNIDRYIEEIKSFRPTALVGYVAPVVFLARRLVATGQKVDGLRGLVTGAEALYEPERILIEQAFGCPVFNTYGTREVMLIAAECQAHSGLHVNADHLLLETVDEGGKKVPAGESGDVAITDFHNFGMPMVRYLNGDRATWTSNACTCGRTLPLLKSVDGRVLETILTPDGRALLGEFFVYLMLDWPEVKRWQVVQTAVDCVEFRLVTSEVWSEEDKEKLRAKVRLKSGESMKIEVRHVDRIDETSSGKRRLTVAFKA